MFIFYTVNPEPPKFPKAFILRVFKDQNDQSIPLKTFCFPVRNLAMTSKVENEAKEVGRLLVKEFMDKELCYDGYGD